MTTTLKFNQEQNLQLCTQTSLGTFGEVWEGPLCNFYGKHIVLKFLIKKSMRKIAKSSSILFFRIKSHFWQNSGTVATNTQPTQKFC